MTIIIALLVLLAAWQSGRLSETRRTRLEQAHQGYNADAPPALNFIMVGLGGFRGIVSEALWFRINRLQDEGRFTEVVQLAEWITLLDPHATEAWTYNAWNLAYNICVMMERPEDRLRWVKNGISILRDDALRFNPREPKIFRELAWLYQNKIGSDLDSANLSYKLDLATTMTPLLDESGALHDTPENRLKLKELKLDAELMLKLEREFCVLDWRMAETHALYWAKQGSFYATGNENMLGRRALYQPLMLMTFNGRFIGDLEAKIWKTAPNHALAIPTAAYMRETLQLFPSRNMRTVYLRFLAVAVRELDKANQKKEAQQLYEQLRLALPADTPAPSYSELLAEELK
ncbi:MAG: hypothetical protein PHO37_03135 [Kiritimatiellae bacterium]|nr:hypothetical protein [Kiritimatiellia bacterium]